MDDYVNSLANMVINDGPIVIDENGLLTEAGINGVEG